MSVGRVLALLAPAIITSVAAAHTIVIPIPLTTDQTVPPVPMGESTGTGNATIIVDTHDGSITIIGSAQELTGPMTGAHLHGLAPHGSTAGVIMTLNVSGSTFSGVGVLTPTQLDGLLEGLTYVDVHTAAFPDGELRGQIIVPLPPDVVVDVEMNGEQSVPPVATPGHAEAVVTIEHAVEEVTLHVEGSVHDLLGSATHVRIHGPAAPGATATPFAQFAITDGQFHGHATLGETPLGWVMSGQTYLSVATSLHPTGEIRGQITPKIPDPEAPPCLGDLNDDTIVDGADLTIVLGQWATSSTVADINDDGTVDGNDLSIVLGGWGPCPVAPSVLYAGPVEDLEFHLAMVDGPTLKTAGSGQLAIRLLGTEIEGIYEVELSTASFTLDSVPVGSLGSGGISMRQDLTTSGSISGGTAIQVPFECHSHFPLLDGLYPPIPPMCTEEASSPGETVEELWHGVLHGTVESIGEVLTFEGLLHLHVHKQRSGMFETVEANLNLTLPRKDYTSLDGCMRADRRTSRKSVCVQPVFIGTGPEDPTSTGVSFEAMKATAELTWEQCCVEIEWLAPKYIDQSSFKTLQLLAPGPGVDVWQEWRQLLAMEDPSDANECIEVFFVSSFVDAGGQIHAAGDGVTFTPGTRSAKIVIADGAIVDCAPDADGVLAHQLGHACGVCDHPAQQPGAAGTVMDPTGQAPPACSGAHSTIVKGEQCRKMANGPLVKQMVPEVPCCQTHD